MGGVERPSRVGPPVAEREMISNHFPHRRSRRSPNNYRGHTLPAAFDGDDYGTDKANTPWGYNQETGDTLSRGDFFLDPARALAYHTSFSGDFSLTYSHNPYLADLERTDK